MSQDQDDQISQDLFYERADEFILLANQLSSDDQTETLNADPGKVSASFMYANARYSVWLAACQHANAAEFKLDRQSIIDYFTDQFKMMLEDNFDEYHENFDSYFDKPEENEVKRFV